MWLASLLGDAAVTVVVRSGVGIPYIPCVVVVVFAIYQILLGWKTYKYYYETAELPNPRPTQRKTNRSKVAFGPLFSTANIFSWVGIDCM